MTHFLNSGKFDPSYLLGVGNYMKNKFTMLELKMTGMDFLIFKFRFIKETQTLKAY